MKRSEKFKLIMTLFYLSWVYRTNAACFVSVRVYLRRDYDIINRNRFATLHRQRVFEQCVWDSSAFFELVNEDEEVPTCACSPIERCEIYDFNFNHHRPQHTYFYSTVYPSVMFENRPYHRHSSSPALISIGRSRS